MTWRVKMIDRPVPASVVVPREWQPGKLQGWGLFWQGNRGQRHFEGTVLLETDQTLTVNRKTEATKTWWQGASDEEKEARLETDLKDDAPCWVKLDANGAITELATGAVRPGTETAPAGVDAAPTLIEAGGVRGRPVDGRFYNPYAFVGLVPRNDEHDVWGRLPPVSRARWHDGRLSGVIQLELQTLTPYFSAKPVSREQLEKERGDGLRTRDPLDHVPASTLKGAIRSVYETLTNSCLSVFDPTGRRLSYRTTRNPGELEPLRIHVGERDGARVVEAEKMQMVRALAYGGSDPKYVPEPKLDPTAPNFPHPRFSLDAFEDRQRVFFRQAELAMVLVCKRENVTRLRKERDEVEAFFSGQHPGDNARLPRGQTYLMGQLETLEAPESQTEGGLRLPPGTKVVRLDAPWRDERSGKNYRFLVLRRDADGSVSPHRAQGLEDGTQVWCGVRKAYRVLVGLRSASDTQHASEGWKEGFVRRLGPVIGTKRFEAVFFPYEVPSYLRLPEGVEGHYQDLLREMQDIHEGQPNNTADGGAPWSPFITEPERARLREGDLLFGKVRGQSVERLYPVQMSRGLYDHSIRDVLAGSPLKGHLSCDHADELCPACRLFGWVARGGSARGGLRGRLRFTAARHVKSSTPIERFPQPVPLEILSSPKPTLERFYLRSTGRQAPSWDGRSDSHPAGRKHYWHHLREVRATDVQRTEHDRQNTAITGWVPKSKRFEAKVRFEDLSPEELGALLTCLTLPEGVALRMGAAKPLGLGSFQSRVTAIRVIDPNARYGELAPGLVETTAEDVRGWLQAFGNSLLAAYPPSDQPGEASLEEIPFVGELVRVLSGPPLDLPIHTPRLPGNPEGFRWFELHRYVRLPGPCEDDPSLPE